MARLLSDQSMERMAHELGVAGIVEREGWGGVPTRECGSVVRVAVRLAEEALMRSRGAATGFGPARAEYPSRLPYGPRTGDN